MMKFLIVFNVILAVLIIACSSMRETVTIKPKKPKITVAKPVRICTKRPIVVAVIDTGFGVLGKGHEVNLCKFGHKNFSNVEDVAKDFDTKDPVPLDNQGHGTNVTGIIDDYVKKSNVNYCIVIIKYVDPNHPDYSSINSALDATIKSIKYASAIHADFINYSSGGYFKSKEEKAVIKKFIDEGGTFVAAAGNANSDVKDHPWFPAMYDDRIISVGALTWDGNITQMSNYGDLISRWELGENVTSLGLTMSGTSQATAIATGKLVSEIKNDCN